MSVLEITVNTKQIIAVVWTIVAVVLSLIIVLSLNLFPPVMSWPIQIGLFFGVFLVITLPVYLLLALWAIATRPESE